MNYVQNLSLYFNPGTQMNISAQGYRDFREGTSPFREKSSKKDRPFNENQSQSSYNGVRTRYDILDPQSKVSDRSNISKTEHYFRQNTNLPFTNEERNHISSYKPQKQYQNYSCFNQYDYDNCHKKGSMNDFSFQAEFGHQNSQQSNLNMRRENARMKGLQVKINNIESLNEKIYDLLNMVKRNKSKNRSKDKLQSPGRAYSKKIMENVKEKINQNINKTDISTHPPKNKENSYSYGYNDMSQTQNTKRYDIKPRNDYISQYKNTPLSTKEQNIEKKPSYTNNIHQKKSMIQLLDKETQQNTISYSPNLRNRRRTVTNIDQKQKQSYQQQQKLLNREAMTPSTRKERVSVYQTTQKSIQDMINQRRMQRNMKQQQNTQSCKYTVAKESGRSNKNTPKQNETIKTEEKANLTGRIYKKNEVKTPQIASYNYKKSLQLDENLF